MTHAFGVTETVDQPAMSAPSPELMSEVFKPDSDGDEAMRTMVMLLDGQDQAPSIRRLRDWALTAAAVQAGETVLDVGSGTGTMTRELADLVGAEGRVIGIEPNPALRAVAEERAAGAEAARFRDGLADALPFDNSSVDLVWCERVLQHLPDPQGAIAEFARVLRPGGRALLLDSDHGTRVTSDVDPEVEAKIVAAFMAKMPNPRAARNIPRQAMHAGLAVDPDVGSAALVMPPDILRRMPLLTAASEQAVRDGTITEAEGAEVRRAHEAGIEQGYAFTAVTVFGFLVRKPVTV